MGPFDLISRNLDRKLELRKTEDSFKICDFEDSAASKSLKWDNATSRGWPPVHRSKKPKRWVTRLDVPLDGSYRDRG